MFHDLTEGILSEFTQYVIPPIEGLRATYTPTGARTSRCPHGVGNVKKCLPCKAAAMRAQRAKAVRGEYGARCSG